MTRTPHDIQPETPTDKHPVTRDEFIEAHLSSERLRDFIRQALGRAYDDAQIVPMSFGAEYVLESWLRVRAPLDDTRNTGPLGTEFPIRIGLIQKDSGHDAKTA